MKISTRFSICLIKLKDLLFVFFLLFSMLNANAQSNPIFPNNQTLVSGTANQPGAVYLIEDVELTGNGGAFDVDAILTIVSFTGTPTINSVDDTQFVQNRFEPVINYTVAGQAVRWRMEFIVANSADSDLSDAVSFPLDSYTLEIIDLDAEEWAEVIVPDSYELAGTAQPQTIITASSGVVPNSIRFTSANITDAGVSVLNTRSVVKVNYENVSVVDFTLGRDNNDPVTTRNISVGFLGEVAFGTPNVVLVNQAPVVVDNLGNVTSSNTSFSDNVLTGSSDPDANLDPASVSLIDPNDFSNQGSVGTPLVIAGVGTYTVNSVGDVVFTPVQDFTGDASILFTVQDDPGAYSNQGNLQITVVDECDVVASGNPDMDNDGVSDICDLDNDNDGILDINEGICTTPEQSGTWTLVSGTEATFNYTNGVVARLITNSTGFQTNGPDNFNTGSFWSETLSGDISLVREYSWGSTLTVSFENLAGDPISVSNPILHVDRLGGSDGTTENSALMTLQGGLTWTKLAGSGTDDFQVTPNTAKDSGSSNPIGPGYTFESTQGVADGTAAGSLQINGYMSTFTIQFVQDGVSGVLSDGIEFILFACTDLDTDGDGTPDYLDLDSDDDGCSDALEGTGIIDAGSVVNGQLTGAVDTVTGVPSNVDENLGQGVGGSIDGTPSDSNGQCDSDNDGTIDANDLCEGFDDNMNADGDAYPDGCDEDDDNDGITDVNEGLVIAPGQPDCGTETTLNFNNAYTEESGDGNVATILEGEVFRFANVTTGVDALVTIVDFNNITSLPTLDDNGSNPNSFQPQSAFSLTSEGDQAWTEFQFDFVASGTTTPVVISKFFANFNDVDGGANYGEQNWSQLSLNYVVDSPTELSITNAGSWIVGTAGNNEYPGVTNTFPQVNYSTEHGGISSYFIRLGAIARVNGATANGRQHNVQFACVNNFVNPISTISIDTDGDGIPNHLDTDSDADGCPDAIEGNGGILLSQLDGNDMISGAINTNGIPTAANSGNGQADVSATDDMVNGCFGDITGVVYEDLNGNGDQDGSETGFTTPVTVFADLDGDGILDAGEPTATTAADGSYTIEDVPVGAAVDIVVDESTLPTGASGTEGTNPTNVTPVGGTSVDAGTDGYTTAGTVTGLVYNDEDGNGTQDGSETGFTTPVTVFADLDGDGVLDAGEPTATTAADGTYTIEGVPAGTVDIVVDETTLPTGSTLTEGTEPTSVTVPTSGTVDAGTDGYTTAGTVTGLVYNDEDGDGTQNGTETGFTTPVTVFADLDGNGVLDAGEPTGTTAADGTYTIDGVPAGTVDIIVDTTTLPVGATLTEGTEPTEVTVPVSGTVSAGIDGYTTAGSVTGTVYNDEDGDGTQNGTETGFTTPVTVFADLDGNGVLDAGEPTGTTAADGTYTIDGVPAGTVDIIVDTTTLPAGATLTEGTEPTEVTVPVSGTVSAGIDGYTTAGSVTGTVYNDEDGDGTQNGTETGFTTPVTVFADLDGNGVLDAGEPTATTAADGTYTIEGVPAGTVDIIVDTTTLPVGATLTEGTEPTSVTVPTSGTVDAGTDGYTTAGTVTGLVYNDEDGDGTQNGTETGFTTPVTVFADLDGNGVLDAGEPTGTTAADGTYTIDGVPAGTVDIIVDTTTLPVGATLTEGTEPTEVTVPVSGTVSAGIDGYTTAGSVTGTVYNDEDGDGTQNGTETGFTTPVTVFADLDGNGVLDAGEPTGTTAADGTYTIDGVPAGTVDIIVDTTTLPVGATLTEGTEPTEVTVPTNGTVSAGTDGYTTAGSVTGTVYNDEDGDGTQNGTETGFTTPVTVFADLDGNGVLDAGEPTGTTAADGTYTIDGVPAGTVDIIVDTTTLPAGATLTEGTEPTEVTVPVSGTVSAGIDGYTTAGSVTGTVYNDEDGDGTQNGTETGFTTPVTVFADLDGNGVLDAGEPTATTAADGTYTIEGVPAGTVDIIVDTTTLPVGATLTEGTEPTSVTVPTSGTVDAGTDGYTTAGTVTGLVYNDEDGDGTQNGTETGFTTPVTVFADLDGNGVLDAGEPTGTTAADGTYTIDGVPAGTVDIIVDTTTLPVGATLTEGTEPTEVTVPVSGTVSAGIDGYTTAGSVTGTVYNDEDGDGTQNGTETGFTTPVTVFADLDGNGVLDAGEPTGTTAADGTYTIDGVPAGTVDIIVDTTTLPVGATLTEGTEPTEVTVPTNGTVSAGTDGYTTAGSVTGTVYNDEDGDGTQNGTETGFTTPVTVFADLDGNGVLDAGEPTGTTAADGTYTIPGVPAGTVDIIVDTTTLPVGATLTEGTEPTEVTVPTNGTVSAGTDGYTTAGSVTGTVYNDEDGDGTQNGTETGFTTPVTVFADLDGNGVLDAGEPTGTTAADGTYTIPGVPAGTVDIIVDTTTLPAGATLTEGTEPTEVTVPTNGTVSAGIDGYTTAGSVTGTVYNDEDGDGTQNGTETGFTTPVTVFADLDGNGVLDAGEPTGTTAADGTYTIDGVPAGTVDIIVDTTTLPVGATLTEGTEPTEVIVPTSGTVSAGTDGYTTAGSVTGTVYNDEDGDGTQNGTETGFTTPVTVFADLDGNGVLDAGEPTGTTAADGTYTIDGVPAGTVDIIVDTTTLPVGATLTEGTEPTEVTVPTNGTVSAGTDGYTTAGSVTGTVYNDEDGDGTQNGTETGFTTPVTVFADLDGNGVLDAGEPTGTTAADGTYTIPGVPAGTVDIIVDTTTLPVGATLTEGTEPTEVTVPTNGTVSAGTDGYTTAGSVTGTVYNDEDGDGTQNGTETGFTTPVTVFADLDGNGVLDAGEPTGTTAADGTYTIPGVPAGTVDIIVDTTTLPVGATLTEGTEPTEVTVPTNGTVSAGTDGYTTAGSVTGTVYNDEDGDGTQNGTETGFTTPVTVFADLDGNGVLDAGEPTGTTAADGTYTIPGVPAGTVDIIVDTTTLPVGATLTEGTEPTEVTVPVNGTVSAGIDGYTTAGSVTGTVYNDEDGDGTQNGTETGFTTPVTVFADLDGNGALDVGEPTGTTAADGTYTIPGVPAGTVDIIVDETTLPVGATLTEGTEPTEVTVPTNGTVSAGIDGYTTAGSVTGTVYNDEDGDGTQNGTETGFTTPVTVFADLDGNGVLDVGEPTGTTAADGTYTIDGVPAGTVDIIVDTTTLPVGVTLTEGTEPTEVIVPTSGTVSAGTDGYTTAGSVTGTVYNDEDGDGTQNGTETGFTTAVTVFADLDGNGVLDAGEPTGTTAADGTYTIPGVPAGTVDIIVDTTTLPVGATLTEGTEPTEVTVPTNGTVSAGTDGYTTAGSVTGTVYNDEDGDGTQNGTETGFTTPVTVFADLDGNGVLDAGEPTGTTAADGTYTIPGVPAGTVDIIVDTTTLPVGATLTEGTEPTEVTVPTNGTVSAGTDGYTTAGSVTGTVYNDEDGDGTQNGTETGFTTPVTVFADLDGNGVLDAGEPTGTTAADGTYTIDGVPAGTVDIIVDETTLPVGVTLTEGTEPTEVTVPVSGTVSAGTDGYTTAGSVTGTVYNDEDGDGTQNGTETGFTTPVTVFADLDGNGVLDAGEPTGTTAADGTYTIPGVPAGTVDIIVDTTTLPVGATLTEGTEPTEVTVPTNGTVSAGIDGYTVPCLSIPSEDCDGDGTPNSSDPSPLDPCIGGTLANVDLTDTTSDWATADCDGDGVSNLDEVDPDGDGVQGPNDTDPNDACEFTATDITLPVTAITDCDGDGETSDTDPNDTDPCIGGTLANVDLTDTTSDWATADCDGDGVSNLDEVDPDGDGVQGPNDTDPNDACEFTATDITLPVTAITDCDGDGETSDTDPNDTDPCIGGTLANVDLTDTTSDWATADCDGDGVSNLDEVDPDGDGVQGPNDTDPNDACEFTATDITLPVTAITDCDGDGETSDTDPNDTDPCIGGTLANVDLTDTTSDWATADCDGDGVSNLDEVDPDGDGVQGPNDTDPNDACEFTATDITLPVTAITDCDGDGETSDTDPNDTDPCIGGTLANVDLTDTTSDWATADCDGDGVSNLDEVDPDGDGVQGPNDTDPNDACEFTATDITLPVTAITDCDGDGETSDTDPNDTDPCIGGTLANVDLTDTTSDWATADCDGDGVSNLDEVDPDGDGVQGPNDTDPNDACEFTATDITLPVTAITDCDGDGETSDTDPNDTDPCIGGTLANVDLTDTTSDWATADCDGDGVSNLDEVDPDGDGVQGPNDTDPNDACEFTATDITLPVTAITDCDGDGETSDTDPNDTDPCIGGTLANVDLTDTTSDWATADCDGDGVSNLDEVDPDGDGVQGPNDTDPNDACEFTATDITLPVTAITDCDGDGETSDTDPNDTDPCIGGTLANVDLTDTTSDWATADCDGDGVSNLDEVDPDGDGVQGPNDTDPNDACEFTATDITLPVTAITDCDGDGETSDTDPNDTDPCIGGTLANVDLTDTTSDWATADCDGDGVSNLDEVDPDGDGVQGPNDTDPNDACEFTATDITLPVTAITDCDGDGETSDTDPNDTDPCIGGTLANVDLTDTTSDWATADCDGDGVSNLDEVDPDGDGVQGPNDTDPNDACEFTATDITLPVTAITDCDGDGETSDTDPNDTDPCIGGTLANVDLTDTTSDWATADCDGDGVSNLDEVDPDGDGVQGPNDTDPNDACEFTATDITLPVTAITDCDGDGETSDTDPNDTDPCIGGTLANVDLTDTTSDWATADCDGDGVSNLDEVDPDGDGVQGPNDTDPNDACEFTATDITLPVTAITDCDGDGETSDTDPNDTDPCIGGTLANVDLTDTTSDWATADCDGDGVSNLDEVDPDGDGVQGPNDTDPNDACEFTATDITLPVTAITDCDGDGETSDTDPNDTDPCIGGTLANVDLTDTTSDWATADCDGDGVSNLDEVDPDGDGVQGPNDTDPNDACEFTATDITLPVTAITDCDGDGETSDTDPNDTDPCIGGTLANVDLTDTTSDWATADCDGDGVSNLDEVDPDGDGVQGPNDTDPNDACEFTATDITLPVTAITDCDGDGETSDTDPNDTDPCIGGTLANVDLTDTTSDWATADCDGDGVSNLDEVDPDGDGVQGPNDTDPNDACEFTATDITLPVTAITDCDGDGETSDTDPNDTDPCIGGTLANVDLTDTTSDWATADCDGDGVSNLDEVDPDGDGVQGPNDTDPNDACEFTATDITLPVTAITDCDGDGETSDTDPNDTDPCIGGTLANVDLTDTTSDWATADCDGDGVSNLDEVDPDGDGVQGPNDTDPNDACEFTATDITLPVTAVTSCDTDGDGVLDSVEILNGTDPNNPCSYNVEDITEPITAGIDCDGDGVIDADEVMDGTDPHDYCDLVIESATVDPSAAWLADDCDRDNVPNGEELGYGDTDGDGMPNFNDTDDDNDGVDTINEDYTDTDVSDGDVDPTGDGLPANDDTDDDGTPDYLDTDDDNDGILTSDEYPGDGFGFDAFDSDGDGLPDYLEVDNGVLTESDDDIEIFNAVTPNGDYDNDVFTIENIELFPENQVRIYNRWGVLVYDALGYGQNGEYFSGRSSGRVTISEDELLPEGTYFYVVSYVKNGETKEKAGYLYIHR